MLSSQLEVGLADTKDVQHDTHRRDLAVSAEVAGVGLALGLPFDVGARIARDVSTTGSAQLERSMANSRIAARWERSLDAEGGLFKEPTLRDLFGFEVRDTIGGRTIASIEASYGRTRSRVGEGLRVENRNASASLSRQMSPWLAARASYFYSRQTESRGASPQDSERNRAEFALTAAIP